MKRYEDYLKGSSSAADPERDEINDLLNRHVACPLNMHLAFTAFNIQVVQIAVMIISCISCMYGQLNVSAVVARFVE